MEDLQVPTGRLVAEARESLGGQVTPGVLVATYHVVVVGGLQAHGLVDDGVVAQGHPPSSWLELQDGHRRHVGQLEHVVHLSAAGLSSSLNSLFQGAHRSVSGLLQTSLTLRLLAC